MIDVPVPMKRCTKCGEEKPATTEYFHLNRVKGDGFQDYCKQCRKLLPKNQEYATEQEKQDAERRREYHRKYYQKRRETHREYYREHNRQHNHEYAQENAARIAEYKREYRNKNQEKIREYYQEWLAKNLEIATAGWQRRRARARSLPNNWTAQDWQRCLEYWRYTCAVCGYPLKDIFGNVPHADHWIPLAYKGADNPGTVSGNMLCLCNSCNLSKHDTLPEIWLAQHHKPARASQILKRVQAYFDWIKSQP